LAEPLTERVGLSRIGSPIRLTLSLFLLELAPVATFSVAARADTVEAGGRVGAVFKSVNNIIEGGTGRGVEGRKTGNVCQAWMALEVVGPRRKAFVVEQEHQEQGTQHAEGIIRWPPTRPWRIEGGEQRACRVEVEAQQDEGGIAPGFWKLA
jgi:hypothetical protein